MTNNSEKNNFIGKLAGFSIGPIVSALIGFLTVPITTWLIDPSMLGKASMFTTVQSLVTMFLFLGFDQAFVREYREYKLKKELFVQSAIIPFVVSILLAVVIFLFSSPLSHLLFAEMDIYSTILLALGLPIVVIKRFSLLIIRMEEKGRLYSLIQILEKLIYLVILIPLLLFWKKSYQTVILSSFLMSLIILIIQLLFTNRFRKWPKAFDKSLLKRMFRFGAPLIPVAALTWIMNSMDKVALRMWSDFSQIGIYAGAFKIVLVMDIVKRSFSTFWVPVSYRWYSEKADLGQFKRVNNALGSILTLGFAVLVVLRFVIIKLLDPAYAEAANLVPFLLLMPVLYTLSETTVMGIGFTRKTEYNIIVSAIVAVVNLSGNFYLVPRYGAIGAAAATAISYIVFFFTRSLIGMKLWKGFSLFHSSFNLLLMIGLCVLSLFDMCLYEVFLLLVILIFNVNQYIYIIKQGREFLKLRLNK